MAKPRPYCPDTVIYLQSDGLISKTVRLASLASLRFLAVEFFRSVVVVVTALTSRTWRTPDGPPITAIGAGPMLDLSTSYSRSLVIQLCLLDRRPTKSLFCNWGWPLALRSGYYLGRNPVCVCVNVGVARGF